jgi:phage terminase Nu1 subunit (DNA packaging protein)
MKEIEISGRDLAEAFGVSERSVRDFADRAIVQKTGRGRYRLLESVRLYTEHLRLVAAGRGGETAVLDLAAERARLAKEQADGQALKNAVARRELVAVEDVQRGWADILRKVRSRILACPSRIRGRLSHLTIYDGEIIDAELRDALTELADDDEEGAGLPETAAEAEAVRVD